MQSRRRGAARLRNARRGCVAAGAYKFVLRPIADGDADIMAQTRLLIDEVLPEVYSAAFEASARS